MSIADASGHPVDRLRARLSETVGRENFDRQAANVVVAFVTDG